MEDLTYSEIRALLDEAIVEALEIADEMGRLVAGRSRPGELAAASARYLEQRALVRRLRGALLAEVGA